MVDFPAPFSPSNMSEPPSLEQIPSELVLSSCGATAKLRTLGKITYLCSYYITALLSIFNKKEAVGDLGVS